MNKTLFILIGITVFICLISVIGFYFFEETNSAEELKGDGYEECTKNDRGEFCCIKTYEEGILEERCRQRDK